MTRKDYGRRFPLKPIEKSPRIDYRIEFTPASIKSAAGGICKLKGLWV